MFRSKIIPAVLVAMMTAGASTMALAAGNGRAEEGSEIHALMAAKVTAEQAITAAEQDTHGQALRFHFKDEKGHAVYEVKTIAKDKVVVAFVDPETGKVIRTSEGKMAEHAREREEKAEMSRFMKSPTNLAAATTAAEKETGGKAIAAAYKDEHGHAMFEVKIAKGDAIHEVMVNGMTGKVTQVTEHERKEKQHEEQEQHKD
jgi:uncharacterized membrane protein YkoI